VARRVVSPVERFLSIEASSGILLLGAALVAAVLANSPLRHLYQAVLHTPVAVRIGAVSLQADLHFLINEGLMTVFFFVIGLEVRREVHSGELSQLRRAALPVVAALGGMIVPAVIYLAVNQGRPSARGWAVPVATDIAFAVGVLALMGRRVPPGLRILLLALAVVDDLGAIVVIATVYSSGVSPPGLLIAGVGVAALLGLQKLGVRSAAAYILPAVVIWAGAQVAGIHPTLAGVVIGLLTPVRAWYGRGEVLEQASASLQTVRDRGVGERGRDLLLHLQGLDTARREAVAPVERLEYQLHGWVAYLIMPLFALANAGVPLAGASFTGDGLWVFIGVTAGLAAGKPLGILSFSWLGTRLGLTVLPDGARWRDMLVVGQVAGIGFTMALFISALAFTPGPLLETAKLAVLCGSVLSAAASLLFGKAGGARAG
jgi:NhaA family Na+:H+ antiporter